MTEASPADLPELEDWEKGKPLRPGWPWWLALMILGDSAPIDERKIREAKQNWDPEDAEGANADMRARFAELQSSTLDNFVRLTIVAAVIAAIIALSQQFATFILGKQSTACKSVSWVALVLIGVSLGCVLLMVVPKLKEWRRFKKDDTDDVGIFVLNSRKNHGWPEFVRLMHRYAHRLQLITFERRVKQIACFTIFLSYTLWVTALALAS